MGKAALSAQEKESWPRACGWQPSCGLLPVRREMGPGLLAQVEQKG